ncbi:MAG: TolC family protein [Tepidisphaeraceae bacterium]|jgi:cobalt-zinc-cadmium efflux system outer membrane protein
MTPRRPIPRSLCLIALLGAAALSGCEGWKKPDPDAQHLAEVNQMFNDRYAFALDTAQLLKTDLRAEVAGPTGDLTPGEAIRRALGHNFSLVTQSASLAIAQANLVQAGLLDNPGFGQTGAFYFPISSGTGPATAFDLDITEAINGFLTQPHKVAIAKAQRLQAGIDVANQAFGLAQQVQTQYDQLVYITRDGALQRRIADTYKQAVDEAQAQLKAGLVTRADFNRAVIAYEDSLRQAHHYDTQYDGAARQMNWLMGVQSAPHWQLPASVSEAPNVIDALPQQQRLEDLAGKYRLDLIRADYDRKIADTSVTLARLGFIPQTTFGADFARDGNKKWTGGPSFSTSLPIFDPGIVNYWLAKDQQEQTERTYVTLQGQVKQDVRNALNALQIAAEDVAFYRNVTIPQEEENVKLAQLSFKLGNSQFDDLLNSIREYVGVLQNYEDAIQAYHQAVIGLESAVGLSFPRIEAETAGAASRPIAAMGTTTAPAILPSDWLTPHTPFRVLDTTQPTATQRSGDDLLSPATRP